MTSTAETLIAPSVRRDRASALSGGVRFVFVNAFSFVKRFFYFDPAVYGLVSVLPLLAIATRSFSRRGIFMAAGFASYYALLGEHVFPLYFVTFWTLQICLPLFQKMSFENVLRMGLPLFWVSAAYGVWQNYYGYSPIEMEWIESGLGVIGVENYFLVEDIRPFSVFAGVPEFGFFVACYLYYFYTLGKRAAFISAGLLLIVIGSRGLLVATAIAALSVALRRLDISVRWCAVLGFAGAILSYMVFAVFLPPFVEGGEVTSRMLVYGTFQARVAAALEFIQSITLNNIWFGVGHQFSEGLIPDNLFVNFINNVGIIGLVFFVLILFRDCKTDRALFFFVILMAYGFYGGVIYSYYLMFNFFIGYYANAGYGPAVQRPSFGNRL